MEVGVLCFAEAGDDRLGDRANADDAEVTRDVTPFLDVHRAHVREASPLMARKL